MALPKETAVEAIKAAPPVSVTAAGTSGGSRHAVAVPGSKYPLQIHNRLAITGGSQIPLREDLMEKSFL